MVYDVLPEHYSSSSFLSLLRVVDGAGEGDGGDNNNLSSIFAVPEDEAEEEHQKTNNICKRD